MNSRVTRGASALLAAAALIAGTTSTASAATWSHTDAKGDVQEWTQNATAPTADPTTTSVDITGLKVAHNRTSVVLKAHTVSATPNAAFVFGVIQTPTAKYEAYRMHIGGTTHKVLLKAGKAVRCSGLKATVSGTERLVELIVPTSCIGKPHWVKVGLGLDLTNTTDGSDHVDDALRTGGTAHSLGLSPKIARG